MTVHASLYEDSSGGLRDALDAVLPDRAGTIALSTASRQVLRSALVGRTTRDCPVVRGRTVWPVRKYGLAIVESPNRYGRREIPPATIRTSILVTESGARLPESWKPSALVLGSGGRWQSFPIESSATAFAWDISSDRRRYEARTHVARDLARRLAQVARVHLAHGIPESPTFVILVPCPPEAVSRSVREVTAVISTVPMVIAGLPGSLRVTVENDPGQPSTRAYVERFSIAVMEKPGRAAG